MLQPFGFCPSFPSKAIEPEFGGIDARMMPLNDGAR